MTSREALTISVVLATNRPGRFLDEALESVRNQTLKPVDVVLVDDGASDPEAYGRLSNLSVVTTLLHQPALGVSIARNRGLLAASGELVAFLDDDDRWPPGRLEAHVRALEADPAAVISYDNIVHINETGEEVFRTQLPDSASLRQIRSRDVGLLLPCCVVRREPALLVGGFQPTLRRVQDFDFLLNLLVFGDAVHADSHVEYRSHADNATSRHREVVAFQLLVARLHRAQAHWTLDREAVKDFRSFEAKALRFAGWSAQRTGRGLVSNRDYVGAAREGFWLLRNHPTALLEWFKNGGRKLSSRAFRGTH